MKGDFIGKWLGIALWVGLTCLSGAAADKFAGVSWVLYANREDFIGAHSLIRDQFCLVNGKRELNRKTIFGIPEKNYFTASMLAPLHREEGKDSTFEEGLDHALGAIASQSDPHVVINIVSHGLVGNIGRQCGSDVSIRLLGVLLRLKLRQFTEDHGRRVKVWFFYSACHSASLIDEFESLFRDDDEGKFTNGGGHRYSEQLRIFTSSDADDYGYGDEFVRTKMRLKENHPDWLAFMTGRTKGRFNYWSSYDENLASEAEKSATNRNSLDQRSALRVISRLDLSRKQELEVIRDVLATFDVDAQIEAMKFLRRSGWKSAAESAEATKEALSIFVESASATARAEAAWTVTYLSEKTHERQLIDGITSAYRTPQIRAKIASLHALRNLGGELPRGVEELFERDRAAYSQMKGDQIVTGGIDSKDLNEFLSVAEQIRNQLKQP